jgi:uncharacterized protein YjbI with pentapeptide repeats
VVCLSVPRDVYAHVTQTNYTQANYSQANYSQANYSHVNYKQANYTQTNLTQANLTQTHIREAHHAKTDISNIKANLAEANAKPLRITGSIGFANNVPYIFTILRSVEDSICPKCI